MTKRAKRETIGQRLKRLRLDRGLSQRQLACPGVSYAYISRIEAGSRSPSVKALRRVAAKLDVSVEYLETGIERLCVSVPVEAADEMLRSGTRVPGGDDFGLAQLDQREREILETELQSALLTCVRSAGFGLRIRRETGAAANA